MNTNNGPGYKIVVLGANGGIGKQAVLCALQAGHQVTAILRTPANLDIKHHNLQIVQGDILKPGALDVYLIGQDAVISAIGKNSVKKTSLYSKGAENLVKAMKKAGTKRAFFISAAGLDVNPSFPLLLRLATKFVLQTFLRNMFADLRLMENVVKDSDIHWTIMRPPKLVDDPGTGNYRTAANTYLTKGIKISRADVAHFMIHHLMDGSIFKKTVEIAY